MYTSVTDYIMKCKHYSDVDLGDAVLDFSDVTQRIKDIRQGISKETAMYVGTIDIFWSMLDRDGEPIQPGDVLERSWNDLISECMALLR